MNVKIINSGSNGNCTILQDINGNQILLDCGLSYETIINNVKFSNVNFILLSHYHKDHSKSLAKLQKYYFQCYTPANIEDGKPIETTFWKIIPMKLVHNVECFGFLIYNKIEKKKIAYVTDTSYIPKLANIDCLICDTNYDEEIVFEKIVSGDKYNLGYKNHMSNQGIVKYLQQLNFKVPYFVAFHISNSSLNKIPKIKEMIEPLVENLIIAAPNTEFKF